MINGDRFYNYVRLTFLAFSLLFALMCTGCIDITGTYSKKLKAVRVERENLKSILKSNQFKLDEKDVLEQSVAQYEQKITTFNDFRRQRAFE